MKKKTPRKPRWSERLREQIKKHADAIEALRDEAKKNRNARKYGCPPASWWRKFNRHQDAERALKQELAVPQLSFDFTPSRKRKR